VIVVGRVSNPRIDHEFDDTQYFDMSLKGGLEGSLSTRFTLLKQWGTIDVNLKAVDVKSGTVVWKKDKLKGYVKYVKSFRAQIPKDLKKAKDDKIIKADIRRHIAMRIIHTLYPDKFKDKEVPEILEKPKEKLIRAGGKPVIF